LVLKTRGLDEPLADQEELQGELQRLRQQAATAAQENESRYLTLLDGLGEGVACTDAGGRFTYANPAAEAILGLPRGGLVGCSLHQFTHPDDEPSLRTQTAACRQGGRAEYEVRILLPDKTERRLQVTAVGQLDGEGCFAGTVGLFRDTTARQQMERLQLVELVVGRIHGYVAAMRRPDDWFGVTQCVERELRGLITFSGCGIRLVDPGADTYLTYAAGESSTRPALGSRAMAPALAEALADGLPVYRRNWDDMARYGDAWSARTAAA
jgi:PAS domain S-box-containing protein